MKILIKNCTVLPMSSENYFVGSIAIEGNRIVGFSDDFEADIVIDGTGKIAMPGLINTHTHAAMTLMRGYSDDMELMDWLVNKIWPIEAKLTAEDIYWGSMLSVAEMISSGTTTYVDMYWDVDSNARVVEESGIRSFFSITAMDRTMDAVESEIESNVKRYKNSMGGRFGLMIAPHAPYTCSPDTLRRCVAIAKKYGLILHTHLCETEVEVEGIQSQYGLSPVDYYEQWGVFEVPVLAAHCVHVTEKEMEKLCRYGVSVAHNPISNMKLASGAAPVVEMMEKGVNVALGTDGASSNNNLDLFEEMRTAALLQKLVQKDPKALRAYEALRMVTVNGAKAIGMAGELGEIKEGMLADLILINGRAPHLNPLHNVLASLVYAGKGSDVTDVVVDGRVLMRDGLLTTIDMDTILKNVAARAENLR